MRLPKVAAITLDGSHGEGGGSVVRAALIMSSVTSLPVVIENVRGGLRKPGVNAMDRGTAIALGEATEADFQAVIGEDTLRFAPRKPLGKIRAEIDLVAMANRAHPGSATLLLQSLLAPLSQSGAMSHVSVRGGTHVPYAPSFDYFRLVTVPAMQRLGIYAAPSIQRAGYSPRGHGELSMEIEPSALEPFDFSKPGNIRSIRCSIATSELPESVGKRAISKLEQLAHKDGLHIKADFYRPMAGAPGAAVSFGAILQSGFGGSQCLGEKGRRMEDVVEHAYQDLVHFLNSNCGADEFTADQLIIPAVLSGGPCTFTASCLSKTLTTTAWVVKQFMPVKITIIGDELEPGEVRINADL